MTKIQELQSVRLFNSESLTCIINRYLDKKKERSEETYRACVARFNEFFTAITGKEVNSISWNDLKAITFNDCLSFQQLLQAKGNSHPTINQKLSMIKKLYEHLNRHDRELNINVVDVEPLDVNPHKVNSYGSLSEEEVNKLFDYCLNRKCSPKTQQVYFRTLFITAIREKCAMELNVSQLLQEKDVKTGKLVWVLKIKDKKKYDKVSIPDSLAEDMIDISNKETGKIFNITLEALKLTLEKFCADNDIDKQGRNITIHSLKKAAGDYNYYNSGKDILKTAKSLRHSNIQTTFNRYTLKNQSLTEQLSYSLHNEKPSIEKLESLSKDELINLIKKGGTALIRELTDLLDAK